MLKRFRFFLGLTSIPLALMFNAAHAAFSCADTVSTGVPQIECEALVALYDSTNGDNWTNNTNWKTNRLVDSWYGIEVENGNVISIIFGTNNLYGTLPVELGNLTSLKKLYISHSLIVLGNLNKIVGTIPTSLGKLTQLESINLSSNELTGSIPTEFANLTNLKELFLGNNYLTGNTPYSSLTSILHNIEYLSISNNCINPLDSSVQAILDAKDSDWNTNQTQCTPPARLDIKQAFSCKNTTTTGISQAECEALIALYNSTNGDSWRNNVNWKTPRPINDWYGISVENGSVVGIDLPNNNLYGDIPVEIGNFPNLQRLSLGYGGALFLFDNSQQNQITGTIPNEIGKLIKLEELRIENTHLTGTIPTEFANLTSLKLLYLYSNYLAGDTPSSSLAPMLNGLEYLLIGSNCINPSDSTIRSILDAKNSGWNDNQTQCTPPTRVSIDQTFSCANTAATGISQIECEALVALYDNTNGDNWNNNLNWKTSRLVDDWYGIQVENGVVTSISLLGNNLYGTLPSNLGYLSNLKTLNIANGIITGDTVKNIITGRVPNELSQLTQLEELLLPESLISKLTGISTNAYIKSTNPMIAGVLITGGSKEVSVKASTVDNILKPRLIIKTFPAGEILYEGNNPEAANSVKTSIILPEGLYTMEVHPVGTDGQGIIEIYEAIAGDGRLQGISTNAYVKSTNPMIAGILVEGGQKQVLVKATSIDKQIIPLMRIKAFPSGTLITENLNSASSLAIQETVTLSEGLYTMEIYPTGVDGQAIIEVYEAQ